MSSDFQTQIAELRAAKQLREEEVLRLQTEIADLERDIAEFEARYNRVVGVAQMRLEAVKAAIEELVEQRRLNRIGNVDPQPSWTPPPDYVPVEEQYRRAWQKPALEPPPTTPPKGNQSQHLKRLYRDLVRRFHPDLARDPAERQRRTEIMSHINDAYARQDVDTLEVLASQTKLPEDVPLAMLTVRHLQKTLDDLDEQVNALKRERDLLFYGEMMRLKLDEKLAKMRGRDLLREIVQEINAEYFELFHRLDELRRRGF